MNNQIKKNVRKIGIRLSRNSYVSEILKNTNRTYDIVMRMKIINYYNIDTLIDIGANIGQYALDMRAIGYNKRIISFEPLKSAFKELEKISSSDDKWLVQNYALGDQDVQSVINVSDNSVSSSILNILPTHLNVEPKSKYISKEKIEIRKIDSILNSFCKKENNIMVKIDTQGFEKKVIDGAIESLSDIKVIQLEMSIIPLYEDEMLFVEMINYLNDKGFQLFSIENGHSDLISGQLFQIDGIFVQKSLLNKSIT